MTHDQRAWLARSLCAAMLASAMAAAPAQDAVQQLQRVVNEDLLLRPAELGIVQVVDLSDGTRWTQIYLPFDELRPRPRKLAADNGWQPGELVHFLISRNFKDVLVCQRDVVDGC